MRRITQPLCRTRLESVPMPIFRAAAKYCVFVLCTVSLCFGQKTYDIRRATSPITIDGKLDEAVWQRAKSVGDFDFPWFKTGTQEQTIAKLLWDDQNLYVSWQAMDQHISASITERH